MADKNLQYQLTIDTSKFQTQMESAGQKVKKAMDPAQTSKFSAGMSGAGKVAGGMGSAIKKVGGVIAAAFAVDKIKDFFVEGVKSAATLSAIEAQFDQVFGKSTKTVQASLEKMGQEMGILPERLKPGLSKLTSMFKGLGIESEEATSMAGRGMTAAADAAAFYDKSLEEAQGNLTSFIKGNYEGGESIGLFSNATQMAAWSTKNLKKDFNKMTEAQKQSTRLKFAEDMMKKSGAMGQASREADGLENQMGNLKSAWEGFTAKVGKPILEKVVIPALKNMSKGLADAGGKLQKLAGIFNKTHKATGSFGNAIEDVFDSLGLSPIGKFISSLEKTAKIMKEDLKAAFDEIKPAIDEMGTLLEPLMDTLGELAKMFGTGLSKSIKILAPFIALVIKGFTELAPHVMNLVKKLTPLVDAFLEIADAVSVFLAPALKWVMDLLRPIAEFLMGNLGETIAYITGIFKTLSLFLKGDFAGAWEMLKTTIWNFVTGTLENIGKLFSDLGPILAQGLLKLSDIWVKMWGHILNAGKNIWNKIKEVAVFLFKSMATLVVNNIKWLSDGFIKSISWLYSKIKPIFNNVVTFILNKIKELAPKGVALAKSFGTKFINAFLYLPSKMVSIGGSIISGLFRGLNSAWGSVTSWVSNKVAWIGNTFKKALKINSPSKVFVSIGQSIDEGLVKGLAKDEHRIDKQLNGIASSIPRSFEKLGNMDVKANISAVNASSNQSIERRVVIPIVQLVVQGDIGAVVDKVSQKIAYNTGLMVGGRV